MIVCGYDGALELISKRVHFIQLSLPSPPLPRVQEILSQIQENPANRVCADCLSVDPSWGVVNLGIMVCIECSGVHRSMGILVSKVRSLELDRSIWTSSLIQVSPLRRGIQIQVYSKQRYTVTMCNLVTDVQTV